jgi:hypothetical protein
MFQRQPIVKNRVSAAHPEPRSGYAPAVQECSQSAEKEMAAAAPAVSPAMSDEPPRLASGRPPFFASLASSSASLPLKQAARLHPAYSVDMPYPQGTIAGDRKNGFTAA